MPEGALARSVRADAERSQDVVPHAHAAPTHLPEAAEGADAVRCLIDFLRVLAPNAVVCAHIEQIVFKRVPSYSWHGVLTLFFLSGLLVTQSALKQLTKPGPQLESFISRRIARFMAGMIPAVLLVAVCERALSLPKMGLAGVANGPVALVGNLLMLQDYPVFQALLVLGVDPGGWYIRPYNTAEPLYTIAVQFWLEIAFGVLIFVLVKREKQPRSLLCILALLSGPVVLWNAGAGAIHCLTLAWAAGGLTGYLVQGWRRLPDRRQGRWLGAIMVAIGVVGMLLHHIKAGRGGAIDFQSFTLLALALTGSLLFVLHGSWTPSPWFRKFTSFASSYAFSLYLIHNTIVVIVWKTLGPSLGLPMVVLLAVVFGHLAAYANYRWFERHHQKILPTVQRVVARVMHPRRAAGVSKTSPELS